MQIVDFRNKLHISQAGSDAVLYEVDNMVFLHVINKVITSPIVKNWTVSNTKNNTKSTYYQTRNTIYILNIFPTLYKVTIEHLRNVRNELAVLYGS